MDTMSSCCGEENRHNRKREEEEQENGDEEVKEDAKGKTNFAVMSNFSKLALTAERLTCAASRGIRAAGAGGSL